jgi:acetylcholinesterase
MPSSNLSRHFAFALLIPLVLAAANFASLQQQVLGSVQRILGFENSALPTVTIPQASLVGTIIENDFPVPVEAWLGIPYAQSPIDSLRFAKPQPLASSNETFSANTFGPRCPGKQLLPPGGGPDVWSEDCLTANVFRPTNMPAGKKVPVMVYVHGGAFNRGTAKMHNTASMVGWATQPFVAVSFNYRIGALGFLNSELTHKEGLLNLGLWDQVLLLEWVRDNIGAFGGDAGDVTLVGLSAGAHSVSPVPLLMRCKYVQSTKRYATDWPPRHEHQHTSPPLPQSRHRIRRPDISRPPPLRLATPRNTIPRVPQGSRMPRPPRLFDPSMST